MARITPYLEAVLGIGNFLNVFVGAHAVTTAAVVGLKRHSHVTYDDFALHENMKPRSGLATQQNSTACSLHE